MNMINVAVCHRRKFGNNMGGGKRGTKSTLDIRKFVC